MRNVVCMKWGTKFGPEYVNRLHSMVSRHLTPPFRFACFTEDPEGIVDGVECLPLPDVGWEDGVDGHGWRKVGLFDAELGDLEGDALFLDLDVVVVDSLDPLFEVPGHVMIIRDYRPVRIRGDRYVGNSSVLRFPVGRDTAPLERFRKEFPKIREEVRNEQEYLSRYFHERGELGYWPDAWCPSFKHDCVAKGPLSYVMTPRIPEGSRVIVFHGRPNPSEALEGKGGKFYRHIRPTPWVAEHWR